MTPTLVDRHFGKNSLSIHVRLRRKTEVESTKGTRYTIPKH